MLTKALVVTPRGEVCGFGSAAPSGVIRRLVGGVVAHQASTSSCCRPVRLLCPELPRSGNCLLVLRRKVALPRCRAFMYWLLGSCACPWVLLPFCGGGRNLPAVAFPPRVNRPRA